MASNRKKPKLNLDESQAKYLRKILASDMKMDDRQRWVILHALETNIYHENHQYWLNKSVKEYQEFIK